MQYIENGELMHYGVLGMKWGIKRNPSRAFSKSVKKANRLEKKIGKTEKNLQKNIYKRNKISARYSGFGFASKGDVTRATSRVHRQEYLLDKRKKKYDKWKQHMQKNFQNVKVSDVAPEVRSAGKDYLDLLMKG